MKKALIVLSSFVVFTVLISLVFQSNYALSNALETIASNNGKSFDPLKIFDSLAIGRSGTSGKNDMYVDHGNSPKFTSVSSDSTRTVRTNFAYYHGFKFPNTYQIPHRIIPDKYIPDFITSGDIGFSTAGACGGMAFAALDYFYAHKLIPGYTSTPSNDNPLSSKPA